MDLNDDQLLDVAFDAMSLDDADLPQGLAQRVLAGALDGGKPSTHPAWGDPNPDALTSLRAFVDTAAELGDMLDTLTPGDWGQPTILPDTSVRGLVMHLAGVERYLLGQLGRRPRLAAPRREDHLPVSMAAAYDLRDAPSEEVARAWWLDVMDLIAACAELGPDHLVEYHHLAGSIRGLLLVRTFELWTHADDIRRATGRPADLLDDPRLSLMVNQLMVVLPLGMAMSGTARPGRTARIVVTGPGSASFDVALSPGEHPAAPDIQITADALDLCRLASRRLAFEDLDATVEGDLSLLEPILVGTTAFAAD